MPGFHVYLKKKNWLWESQHSSPNLCFFNRFQEKGNLEVLLFTIQSRMRANNQKVYTPHDGKLVSDINRVQQRFSFHVASGLIQLLGAARGNGPWKGFSQATLCAVVSDTAGYWGCCLSLALRGQTLPTILPFRGGERGKIGDRDEEVQTTTYKINKIQEFNVQYKECSPYFMITLYEM